MSLIVLLRLVRDEHDAVVLVFEYSALMWTRAGVESKFQVRNPQVHGFLVSLIPVSSVRMRASIFSFGSPKDRRLLIRPRVKGWSLIFVTRGHADLVPVPVADLDVLVEEEFVPLR